MIEPIFRLLTVLVIVSALTISGYFRKRADYCGGKASRSKEGRFFAVLLRLPAFLAFLLLFTYVAHPPWLDWARMGLPDSVRWFAAAASAATVGALYWVFSSLGRNVTDTVVVRPEARMVAHGPYRWIRHPLYTFGSLLWLNLSLLTDLWVFVPFLAFSWILLNRRTQLEEKELLLHFGEEYGRYMARTGRYLPRLRGPAV
jgi:protein-S-isoprenylcysteine O-methyltransferase Ste14